MTNLLLLLALALPLSAHAGSKTAGDGGHVVVCDSGSVTFFDIQEGLSSGHVRRTDLPMELKPKDWYERALARSVFIESLKPYQASFLKRFATDFERSANSGFFGRLGSHYNPAIPDTPLTRNLPSGCEVRVIVKTEERRRRSYDVDFCERYPSECFAMDPDLWARLSPFDRRCLALHEALRYLDRELTDEHIRTLTRLACML